MVSLARQGAELLKIKGKACNIVLNFGPFAARIKNTTYNRQKIAFSRITESEMKIYDISKNRYFGRAPQHVVGPITPNAKSAPSP